MVSNTTSKVRLETYVMKGPSLDKALDTYHLILAPTFACNIRCKHCYLPDHAARGLSAERVLRLVDEWSEIVDAERGPFGGIFHLKGGEPLILPYFADVLDRLVDRQTLQFMMTTNGILGDNRTVEKLKSLNDELDGHVFVIVSLDGSNEEINARLRGPANFGPAISFIRRLTEAGVNVFLNNVVHRGNVEDIESFVNLALDLKATQVNFLSFVPKGFGEEMAFGRPDPVEIHKKTQKVWDRGDERIRSLLAGSLSDILHAEGCGTCTSHECVGGYRGLLYIVPDGTAYSCPNLNHSGLEAGNILTSPLANVHNALLSKVYEQIRTKDGEAGDLYLCKGERFVPLSQDYVAKEFPRLQRHLGGVGKAEGVSYCFSRNF